MTTAPCDQCDCLLNDMAIAATEKQKVQFLVNESPEKKYLLELLSAAMELEELSIRQFEQHVKDTGCAPRSLAAAAASV